MTANERLLMMAEDYERRAAEQRGHAARFRAAGNVVYTRACNRTALKYEKQAAECRAGIQRNNEAAKAAP